MPVLCKGFAVRAASGEFLHVQQIIYLPRLAALNSHGGCSLIMSHFSLDTSFNYKSPACIA
jgi:hypothetical protein